jgi:hypothetical protein
MLASFRDPLIQGCLGTAALVPPYHWNWSAGAMNRSVMSGAPALYASRKAITTARVASGVKALHGGVGTAEILADGRGLVNAVGLHPLVSTPPAVRMAARGHGHGEAAGQRREQELLRVGLAVAAEATVVSEWRRERSTPDPEGPTALAR